MGRIGLYAGLGDSIAGGREFMRARLSSLLALGLLTAVGWGAESVQLQGVLAMEHEFLFSLVNRETSSSAWVKVGGTFGDFVVKNYATDTGTLTLEKEGKETRLVLRDAPIEEAPVVAVASDEKTKAALSAGGRSFDEVVAIARAHGRVMLPVIVQGGTNLYIMAPPGTIFDPKKRNKALHMSVGSEKDGKQQRVLIVQ